MKRLNDNGYFITSGIIEEKSDEIIEKLQNTGYTIEKYYVKMVGFQYELESRRNDAKIFLTMKR